MYGQICSGVALMVTVNVCGFAMTCAPFSEAGGCPRSPYPTNGFDRNRHRRPVAGQTMLQIEAVARRITNASSLNHTALWRRSTSWVASR